MSIRRYLSLAPFVMSAVCVAAPQDYCDEIDTNPDLSAGNSRVYDNRNNTLECNLGTSLPGFGSVPVSSGRECQELRMRGEGILSDVVEALNGGLESLDVTEDGEYVELTNDDIRDFFGTRPRSQVDSGAMDYGSARRPTQPQPEPRRAQPEPQPGPQSDPAPDPRRGYFD